MNMTANFEESFNLVNSSLLLFWGSLCLDKRCGRLHLKEPSRF